MTSFQFQVSSEMKTTSPSLHRNTVQIVNSKYNAEAKECEGMNRMLHACERELHELRQQYNLLREKAELRLGEEHKRIGEFTKIELIV